jgi:hypothetical protein
VPSFNEPSLGRIAGVQSTDYAHLLDLDRAGWAWEWLRRNPEFTLYQDLNKRRLSTPCALVLEPDEAGESQFLRWGLHYG